MPVIIIRDDEYCYLWAHARYDLWNVEPRKEILFYILPTGRPKLNPAIMEAPSGRLTSSPILSEGS
jgi:hypothetical protein